ECGVMVDDRAPRRILNRKLGTEFTLEGPKTLNGLIVEYLGEIPDSGISFRLAGQGVEVLQVQDRAVKVVKLLPPVGRAPAPPLQTTGEQPSSISYLICVWNNGFRGNFPLRPAYRLWQRKRQPVTSAASPGRWSSRACCRNTTPTRCTPRRRPPISALSNKSC